MHITLATAAPTINKRADEQRGRNIAPDHERDDSQHNRDTHREHPVARTRKRAHLRVRGVSF
jgi:hypothetical protein